MAVAFAVGTLTFAANAIAAETVVVGGVTYTWRASVASTANEVLVGGSAAASAQNLYDAINVTAAGSGVTYGSATVINPRVRAKTVTATTVVVQSRTPGEIGNLIASTETMTQGSWGAATLASGSGVIDVEIQALLAAQQVPAGLAQALIEFAYDPATV